MSKLDWFDKFIIVSLMVGAIVKTFAFHDFTGSMLCIIVLNQILMMKA
ncbi:unnamed protein product [marine sediment metagenome]|uniref:Uncharacterized protein n=1 Tax=marine sediment metagenome TaxID=412755 RepID=X0UWB8_9ZZZZ